MSKDIYWDIVKRLDSRHQKGGITMNSVYDAFSKFMTEYDMHPHDVPNHPGYTCDRTGNVYRPDGSLIKPFNSSGYKQVYMLDNDGKRSIKGVHQVVSMTFDDKYYDGCVVHHKDENKLHNWDENLQVESISEHARHHADPSRLAKWAKENGGPANKGKTMSDEFKEKCRQNALKREHKFYGNQYTKNKSK